MDGDGQLATTMPQPLLRASAVDPIIGMRYNAPRYSARLSSLGRIKLMFERWRIYSNATPRHREAIEQYTHAAKFH